MNLNSKIKLNNNWTSRYSMLMCVKWTRARVECSLVLLTILIAAFTCQSAALPLASILFALLLTFCMAWATEHTSNVSFDAFTRPDSDDGLVLFATITPMLWCVFAKCTNHQDLSTGLLIVVLIGLHTLLFVGTSMLSNIHAASKHTSAIFRTISIDSNQYLCFAISLVLITLFAPINFWQAGVYSFLGFIVTVWLLRGLLITAPRSFSLGEALFISTLASCLLIQILFLAIHFVLSALPSELHFWPNPLFVDAFSVKFASSTHWQISSFLPFSLFSIGELPFDFDFGFLQFFLSTAAANQDPDMIAPLVIPLLVLSPLLFCLFPPFALCISVLRKKTTNSVTAEDYATWGCIVFFIFAFLYPLFRLLLSGIDPLVWVCRFILRTKQVEIEGQLIIGAPIRQYLCLYWIIAIALAIVFQPTSTNVKAENILVRKVFHALAVIMFIPAIILEPLFFAVATAGAFSVLCCFEIARFANLAPLASVLDQYMDVYRDERDCGPCIVTHIYLLFGCAFPVWMSIPFINQSNSALQLNSTFDWLLSSSSTLNCWVAVCASIGALALGVGDSLASWFGKRFGRHRWTQTRKSIEGTVFASVSIYICLVAILMASEIAITHSQHVLLLLVTTLIMLFEAFTLQIDNLALPPIAFVLCACVLPIKV